MIRALSGFVLLVVLIAGPRLAAAGFSVTSVDDRPRAILDAALRFSEGYWDENAGLLRSPIPGETGRHRVRESAWYALGLLMRGAPGDDARAERILEQVLAAQYDAPGRVWDGTFRRLPATEEGDPPGVGAKLWEHYDPNWRQFIGTTFVLILAEFEPRLPAGLADRLLDSIRRAVEGELVHGRAEPYHTNIKLMHSFLWSWAGARLHHPAWVEGGEQWAEAVAADFARNETFEEYNSPTYYGVDLFGLALWRRLGATERIRALGARLEDGLWRDVGRFYHAGLKNMCGPFDRAYGMDQRRYVSLTGLWMALALPGELAPLPDPAGRMDHAHDFFVAPAYVALGTRIPDEVRVSFRAFAGERLLRRPITGARVATAWLAADLMIGGEITGHTLGATPDRGQFHPATMHWRAPGDALGWMRLYASPPCDAEAGRETLVVHAAGAGDFTFRVSAPGVSADHLSRGRWTLPGLTVDVTSDAVACSVVSGEGYFDVTYRAATRIAFRAIVPGSGTGARGK